MDIVLSTDRIDQQESQVIVTGCFIDERPLRGPAGWIDWRLNGRLSHFLIKRHLTGGWKETTLIPSLGRTVSPLILLFGLGELREYSYPRLRELFPHFLETLRRLNVARICFSFPFGEDYKVDCGKLAEVIAEAVVDGLDQGKDPVGAEWIRGLRIFFAEGETYFEEILLGLQTARSILKGRIDIRIFSPSQEDRGRNSIGPSSKTML